MTELDKQIQEDCANLAKECFTILERVKHSVYPAADVFLIEEYARFLENKNAADIKGMLSSLANKTHGLKGLAGFISPHLKNACHHSEQIIKPLAAQELLLDEGVYALLREFFLRVREYLEFSQGAQDTLADEGWAERFAAGESRGRAYIKNNEALIKHLIDDRSEDVGMVRRRPPSATTSVSRDGYERLLVLATELHRLANSKEDNASARAEALLSEFLQIHQSNKLNPLDVSRYERVVPKLAAQYQLRAAFEPRKLEIRAEDKLLGAIHEIANHIVKNAITHGFERPEERKARGKDPQGKIEFSAAEDALNYYVTISDDGRGIDVKKVADKAVALGVVRASDLPAMRRADVLKLMFAQGLSTAEKVDDNSGRGVGLSAVKEVLDRFLGTVEILTSAGKGTQWKFRFKKTDVALPCMLVETRGIPLAIPEHHIACIIQQDWTPETRYVRFDGGVLGLIDPGRLLRLAANSNGGSSIVILSESEKRVAFPVSSLLGRNVLFVQPAPAIVNPANLFAGVSLVEGNPVLVIDVGQVCAEYKRMESAAPVRPASAPANAAEDRCGAPEAAPPPPAG